MSGRDRGAKAWRIASSAILHFFKINARDNPSRGVQM
jgi:hypothetical protein